MKQIVVFLHSIKLTVEAALWGIFSIATMVTLLLPTLVKSNQIKSNLFCHKFGTQYNNEFALHLAGQTGDNFALMSAHDN